MLFFSNAANAFHVLTLGWLSASDFPGQCERIFTPIAYVPNAGSTE